MAKVTRRTAILGTVTLGAATALALTATAEAVVIRDPTIPADTPWITATMIDPAARAAVDAFAEGTHGVADDKWEVVADADKIPPLFSIVRNHSTVVTTHHLPESAEFMHILNALIKGEPLELMWADSPGVGASRADERAIEATTAARFIPELWQDAVAVPNVAVQSQYVMRHLADAIVAWRTEPAKKAADWPEPYVGLLVESAVAIQANPAQFERHTRVLRETLTGPAARLKVPGTVIQFEPIEDVETRLAWSRAKLRSWAAERRRLCRTVATETIARRRAAMDWLPKEENLTTDVVGPDDTVRRTLRFDAVYDTPPVTINGIVAGALFDFLGFLTTTQEHRVKHPAVKPEGAYWPTPLLAELKAWEAKRGFDYADANVLGWQDYVSKDEHGPTR